METEKMDELEKIILDVDLKLSILHSALKYPDDSDLCICAVSYCVEDIYKKLQEVRNIF